MQNTSKTKPLSEKDLISFRRLLAGAFQAASSFNGTSQSETRLFSELEALEDFYIARGLRTTVDQNSLTKEFNSNLPTKVAAIDDFLSIAGEYYDGLKATKSSEELTHKLARDGVVVIETQRVLVQTDNGQMMTASSQDARAYEVRTEPRLATLLHHLATKGVNGNQLMNDDLVITKGSVADNMMRQHPYYIVQIPSIDMEIAVCDQIGEITFVKQGTVGLEFWEYYSKDSLKAREDITAIIHRNDADWLNDITKILTGHTQTFQKTNTQTWVRNKPKLDIDLIKESLLAHRQATDEWLSVSNKDKDGKRGAFILEHGPYKGVINVRALSTALYKGLRGLPGESSIAKLNQEISRDHYLDYINRKNQDHLDIELIKESLLAHRQATGEWLSASKKDKNGKLGAFILEHGPYKGLINVEALNIALYLGLRGLSGESSIAKLNQQISDEYELDYQNPKRKDKLDLSLIRKTLLDHRKSTGKWLSAHASARDGKKGSYVLEYGPYKYEMTVRTLDAALMKGLRGLEGGSSIAKLNHEISKEYNLDYDIHNNHDYLDVELIRQSLLAHRQATCEWLSSSTKDKYGKTGAFILEHGPYKGAINAKALNIALYRGLRGLPGGSSIAKLNQEISQDLGLDYIRRKHHSKPTP